MLEGGSAPRGVTRREFLGVGIGLALAGTGGRLVLGGGPAEAQTTTDNGVVPIVWSDFTAGNPTDTDALRMLAILLNTNKYALTTWWSEKGYGSQTGTYLSFGGTTEHYIRHPACEAFALATSIKLGVYDASRTGVSLADAETRTVKLAKSLAYRHKSNTSSGWGDAWQSALWAATAGFAGWFMWESFSSTEQAYIRKMVEYEANRFIGYSVPYYRDDSGTVLYPGDSKAEENSWNSMILQVATAMMPNHTNWTAWMRKNLELMISAYARPQNATNTGYFLHGKSLADWLNGSNANEDWTVTNHDRIHPDYMVTIVQNMHAALAYTLAGKPTPKAAFFNVQWIYDALVDLSFASPPYESPGGTIYRDGSSNIYYPQGNDWGTARRMNFAVMDAKVRAFGQDFQVDQKASYWEPYHAQKVLDMQGRHSDGRTYASSTEDTYKGREEWVARHAAAAYLAKWVKKQGTFSITDTAY